MSTNDRPLHDTWQSRGPAAPTAPPLDATPVVTFLRDPDTGDAWHCRLGAYQGPPRATRHAAQADADALAAALAPLAGVAARVDALLASPEARDAIMRHPHNPTSAVLAVLRWVRGPVGADPGPAIAAAPGHREEAEGLRWGDAPTLAAMACGMAVVAGEDE